MKHYPIRKYLSPPTSSSVILIKTETLHRMKTWYCQFLVNGTFTRFLSLFFFNFIANSLRPASPNLPLITKWERVYVLCSCVWLIFLEWHRYCSPLLWSMSRGPVLTAPVTGFVYLLGSLVFLCNGICVLY